MAKVLGPLRQTDVLATGTAVMIGSPGIPNSYSFSFDNGISLNHCDSVSTRIPIATTPQEVEEEATFEELYPTFTYRIKTAFEGISKRQTSSVMRYFIRQKGLILNALYIYTPDNIRQLLDRDDLPSFQDLVDLKWEKAARVGVYIKTISEPDTFGNPRLDRLYFTYVGSATQRKGGLSARKRNTTAHPSKRKSRLIHGDVNRTSKFGVQFSVPTSGLKSKEFVAIRQLSMVAEAVYADILGVYSDHVKDKSLY